MRGEFKLVVTAVEQCRLNTYYGDGEKGGVSCESLALYKAARGMILMRQLESLWSFGPVQDCLIPGGRIPLQGGRDISVQGNVQQQVLDPLCACVRAVTPSRGALARE